MKKTWLITAAALIGLLASCRHPASPSTQPGISQNTAVIFDNTQGICVVVVYDHYQRREEDKIAEVPAGRVSEEIEWTPGVSVPFYFSYRINLKGINGFTLNYIPKEIGKDQTPVRIDPNVKTTITIPKLDETISSPDELLSNSSYLLIQNNSSFSFQLHRGSGIITPDNIPTPLVNSGERAQYTTNPGAVSNYRLLVGADYKALPASLASFEAGRVYSFIFDGAISLIAEVEIKLENVAGVPQNTSGPDAPGAPVVMAEDGLLTLRWIAVEGAENYELYVSTAQEPPASPAKTVAGTTTVLTGLTNKTAYYVWIKALNSSGSSDFSPRSRGIPWPNNEVPATPERLEIIPGINQLTVNWDECGGAVSYELYFNTSTTRPPAPEITTEKTSAVIKNLENDVIYYVWVRAVNSAGESGYSPLEAGTPKIPTTAPAAPGKPVLTAGSRELTVSWQAVELAAAYEIWAGTSDNSSLAVKQGGDIEGDITETVITGLENETVYYVWIRAKNIVGTSGFSPAANARPSAFASLPVAPATPEVSPGSRALAVSWPPAEGALSYEAWAGVTNNPDYAEKHGADASGTSVTLTNLVNGTTYYIWVKSKNNIGTSGFSPVASGTPSAFAAPPPAPLSAPIVTGGSGQITVSWQAAEGANVYEIWAGTSTNPAIAAKRGDDISGLSAVITGLTNNTVYYVWIKAKNTVGTSNFSPMASGIPSAFTVIPQSPAAPSVSIVNGQITVTWAAVEGATAYEVWTNTVNNSASASKNGTDIILSLSTTIENLTSGTTYYVWIKAKNNIGTSGFSPVASVKPLGISGTPTVNTGHKELVVTWTAVAGADEYEVYYGTNAPTTLSTTTTGTTATITGLTNGTTYYVRLRAKNASGVSGYGPTASGVPHRTPGLYRGDNKIGNQNLANSLTYISTNAVSGDDFYIILGVDESISPKNLTYSGKTVGITLLGYDSERRTITLNANGSMFTVNSGVTLILENITLLGRNTNNNSLVLVNDGDIIVNEGTKIRGNTYIVYPTGSDYLTVYGGGVYVSNGTFTMNGGEISGNILKCGNSSGSYYCEGGGVYVNNGTFTMNGGKISGNKADSSSDKGVGGGVFVTGPNVSFTMNGGEINGNTSRNGGGVYVFDGTFTMNGGEIYGNTALWYGGGVENSGTFIMTGGEINGNIASGRGGGVYNGGIFIMNGGEISGNTGISGGGVYVGSFHGFTMSGGEISGNTALSSGGGVHVFYDRIFTKSNDGIITGYISDTVNGNVVKDSSGVVQSNNGHAVYMDSSPGKRRETTAGPGVNLDSSKDGTAGGWEN
jgi:hypothetical protein